MPRYLLGAAILAFAAGALPAHAFEGTYRNDMRTTLKVSKRGAGYQAAIDLVWKGCLGSVAGPATLKGSVMTLRARDRSFAKAPVCTVKITFKDRTATLQEVDGCLNYHGASCGFEGTVRR